MSVRQLRPGSARPELVVDSSRGGSVVAPPPPPSTTVGQPATAALPWIARGRMVTALPLKDGPRLLRAPAVVHDALVGYLGDTDGNLVGVPGVWCSRLVTALWSPDTRRLAG